MYWEYYLMGIILLPGIIFSAWAQIRVNNAFSKYQKILSSSGLTGEQLSKKILQQKNISNVQIVQTSGRLSDNFNPRTKVLSLSPEVYQGNTISSLGVAAHECGHVIQQAENYAPMKIRNFFAVACNISNTLLWPIIFLGLILGVGAQTRYGMIFLYIGVVFFGLSVLFSLITLPIELNASKRALKCLQETNALDATELVGAKEVLNAAALTYVAGLLISILNLLRFVLVVKDRE